MAPRKAGNISSRLRDCILESIHTKIHQSGGERAVNLGLIKYFSSPPFLITITRRPWPTEGLATVAPTLFHLITSTFPHTVCNTCATRGTPSRLPDTGEGESENSSTDGWTIRSSEVNGDLDATRPWISRFLSWTFLLSLSLWIPPPLFWFVRIEFRIVWFGFWSILFFWRGKVSQLSLQVSFCSIIVILRSWKGYFLSLEVCYKWKVQCLKIWKM